ncbi:hypothetical protein BKA62DRAFT_828664 [Auriculariales sp. MPI-PUGE-AT-0066]|nr:hypothetical protein BKA62DRAFT_828664 [Auriculariales sp. MPI-PUGE-AT-0066]
MGLLSRVGFIAAGVACVTATTNVAAVESSSSAPLVSPDVSLARANAPQIFNAVNNAMRQWGSSVHHNGMSLFLVTVPAGNLFYHGCGTPDRRAGFEWLSFEPEHASYFGRSEEPRNDHEGNGSDGQQPSTPPPSSNAQLVMVPADPPADEPPQWPNCPELPASGQRGYIHTYKAARDLRVLYIDGQAAAKSFIGTLDIQNLVLLNFKDNPMDCMMGDMTRARSLCDLMTTEWAGAHIDGILRMEAGFELIYCDFADGGGLDLVSVVGSPFKNETGKADETGWSTESRNERDNLRASDPVPGGVLGMEWIRAVAQRYHGFEPERIEVDFSSMVSAFWYPLNRTNPDVRRPDLPRFVNASDDALLVMYGRVREVLHDRRAAKPSVHWQAVSDRVVSLFGSRLEAMAGEGSTAATMASQISSLVNPFINYGVRIDRNESVSRCATSHLTRTQELQHHWTKEDHLIFAAFEVITHRICNTLFDLRPVLDGPSDDDVLSARATARDLMQWLGWARFRGCAGQDCGDPERICFITMFPAGGTVDHFRPRCKTAEEIGQAESHGYFSTRPAPEEPLFSTMSTSATSYQWFV